MTARIRRAGLPLSAELAWLLAEAPAALGESGTLGSTVSTLERGGGPGYPKEGSPGGAGYSPGDGQRWTEYIARWRTLGQEQQRVLLAYYSPLPRYPRVIAQGYPTPQPIGERIRILVGSLAGVIALLAVTEEADRRREVTDKKLAKALKELDTARAAARDAVPHIVADLEALRGNLVATLHGRSPRGRLAVRLDALEASIRAMVPSGARAALSRYRGALQAVADAQALAEDRILARDWRPLVRMVEKPETKPLGDLNRRALEAVKLGHAAWDAS